MTIVTEFEPKERAPLVPLPIDGALSGLISDNGELSVSFLRDERGLNVMEIATCGYRLRWSPGAIKYVDIETGFEDVLYEPEPAAETWVEREYHVRYNRHFAGGVDEWWRVENGELKHYTSLRYEQRPPLDFLNDPLFAVTGTIDYGEDLQVMVDGSIFEPDDKLRSVCEIAFLDLNGRGVFRFPPVVCWDQNKREASGCFLIASVAPGRIEVYTATSHEWLTSQDRAYPVIVDPTVITSATGYYESGGVVLSNGWLIDVIRDATGTSTSKYNVMVSKDSGSTWTQLCFISSGPIFGTVSVASYGTNVFILSQISGASWSIIKFDAANVTNTDQSTNMVSLTKPPGMYYPAASITSLFIEPTGTIHVALSAKINTSSNSNIFYCSSTNGGASFSALEAVTSQSSSLQDFYAVRVVATQGQPVIAGVFAQAGTANGAETLYIMYKNASTWTASTVPSINLTGSGYSPASLAACVDSVGSIHLIVNDRTKSKSYHTTSSNVGQTWFTATIVTSSSEELFSDRREVICSDSAGKLYLHYLGRGMSNTGNKTLRRKTYSGGTWSSATTVTDGTGDVSSVSLLVRNAPATNAVSFVYTEGTAIKYDALLLNTAPLAPSSLVRANYDATTDALLSWTFNDTIGDTQSAYELEVYDTVAPTAAVYVSGKVGSTSTTHMIAANTLTNGKTYQWRVKTYDAGGLASPWSTYATFKCSAAPVVSVANPGTVSADSFTFTGAYSHPTGVAQKSFRFRLYSAADALLEDSGEIIGRTNAKTFAFLTNGATYKIEFTATSQDDITTTSAKVAFTVAFTPPATPTVSLTNDAANARIKVEFVSTTRNLFTANQSDVETNLVGLASFPSSTTLARDTTNSFRGIASAKVTSTNAADQTIGIATNATRTIVTGGKQYTASAYVKATTSVAKKWRISIWWYDAAGTYLGIVNRSPQTDSSADWTRIFVTATAPANAASCYVDVALIAASNGESLWYDAGMIEIGATASEWDTGGRPRAVSYNVYRRKLGDKAWKQIASGATSPFYDYTCPAGEFEYAVAAVADNGATSDKTTATVTHSFSGQWIIDEQDPSKKLNWLYNGKGLEFSEQNGDQLLTTFADKPFQVRSAWRYSAGTLTATFLKRDFRQATALIDQLKALCSSERSYTLKTEEGFHFRVSLSNPRFKPKYGGNVIEVVVDWAEVEVE